MIWKLIHLTKKNKCNVWEVKINYLTDLKCVQIISKQNRGKTFEHVKLLNSNNRTNTLAIKRHMCEWNVKRKCECVAALSFYILMLLTCLFTVYVVSIYLYFFTNSDKNIKSHQQMPIFRWVWLASYIVYIEILNRLTHLLSNVINVQLLNDK